VFGRGSVLDDVAAEWLGRFKADEYSAIAEFYSFVLKCAGCEHTVNSEELQDPDNYSGLIDDIQGQYQAVSRPRPLANLTA
jgi:cohesin complex subunit SA-1/2